MVATRFATYSDPLKGEVRKKNETRWPAALLITGLVLAFYLLDSALQEIGQASGAIDQNLLLELCGVVVCLILPALYMQFGVGRSDGSLWLWLSRCMPSVAQDKDVTVKPTKAPGSGQTKSFSPPQSEASQNSRLAPKPKVSNRRPSPTSTPTSSSTSAAVSLARYNQSINAAAKAGVPDQAERLLRDIEETGLKPDVISYNSVIHACAKLGQVDRAEKWLVQMRKDGVEPNTITYNIFMDGCAKK